MRSSGWLLLAMVAVGVGSLGVACTAEVSDPRYGPPGGLRNAQLPSPSGTTTSTGTTPPAGDGGTAPAACTVSFKTDVYPKMTDQGPWKCADAQCHGTQAGTPPFIDPASATNAYTALSKDTSTGKTFINAKSKDPAQSGFSCCLTGACGAQMPPPQNAVGATADATAASTLAAWLTCGAPNN